MTEQPGWLCWIGLDGYVIHLSPAATSTARKPEKALCGAGVVVRVWCRDLLDPALVDLAGIERGRNERVCLKCAAELAAGPGKGHPSHQAGTR